MKKNVVAPSVGESITEVSILKWNKQSGEAVKNGEVILEIESDKATVEVIAESNGVLTILKPQGTMVPIGEVIATIDDSATPSVSAPAASKPASAPSAPATPPPVPQSAAPASGTPLSPAVRRIVTEQNLDPSQIAGTGKDGRLTKGDVLRPIPLSTPATPAAPKPSAPVVDGPGIRRVPMSMLRQRIAERLVHAQHTAAILTTFNEVDMTAVMKLRAQHKDAFKAKHGVSLGFMSFFTRAVVDTLKLLPAVNASIDGKDVLYHDYYDIGIAVGTDRGLVVPVLRDAGEMGFVAIEKKVAELGVRAKDGKLSVADLSGGTFTISNGGVYGSLMSTPILNPPQSGILGMHKIQERPIALNGKVEIRPMMYIALSYDHRLIDGKEAVTFLVQVKDFLENPDKLGLRELG